MPEHSVITDPNIHEPKGASSASANQVLVADGAGGTSWATQWNNWWWNIDHSAAVATSLTSGVKTDIVNDGAGAASLDFQVPAGVGNIWDTVNNEFDWVAGGMQLGDEVVIRLDIDLTVNSNNDSFLVEIDLAHGHAGEIKLPLSYINVDITGTQKHIVIFRVFMGNTNVLNEPAKLSITANSTGDSYLLNGFYVSAEPTNPRFV